MDGLDGDSSLISWLISALADVQAGHGVEGVDFIRDNRALVNNGLLGYPS